MNFCKFYDKRGWTTVFSEQVELKAFSCILLPVIRIKPVQLHCSQEVLKNNFNTNNRGTSLNTCLLQVSVGDRRYGQPENCFHSEAICTQLFIFSFVSVYKQGTCDVALKTAPPHIVLEQKQALNITFANAMFSHHLYVF